MKPRELSSNFTLLPAFKFLLLSALVVLFLNATFSLYANITARYYANPRPPFLKISSFYYSPSSGHNSPPPPPSFFESESIPSSTSFNSFSSPSRITVLSPLPSISDPPSPSTTSSAAYSNPSPPPLISPLSPPILTPSPSPQKFEETSFFNYSLTSPPPPPAPKRRGFPKGCDLAKGEWVRDPNAPYYTNATCWAIQEHQNCMKYGRPDSDFLKWRWKPDGCELPLIEPAGFLELMRGKNLAFIGDSLARNQMQSLMCLLSRVEYPQEIWPPAEDVTQMLYKNYNFTLWTFWSPFLIRAKESMTKDNLGTWSLYLDEPDPLWQPKLGLFDFIVLNTGNWYTRPAQFYEKRKIIGCHYCVFKKVPFMSVYKAHRRAFRTALDSIVQNRQGYTGVTVVRTVSPSHFEGGDWNKGGDCKRTAPFRRGKAKIKGMDLELYKDQWKEFWKAKWEGNEKGLDFRLLDTTQAMVLRPDGHPSRYGHWPNDTMVLYNDCVHWCLPGPVDMWNDFLFQVLSIP